MKLLPIYCHFPQHCPQHACLCNSVIMCDIQISDLIQAYNTMQFI